MKRLTTDGLCPDFENKYLCSWDGGSEPAGQTVVQQSNNPWSGQQPYLETGFKAAEDLFNTPVEYYPNSTVVPFSPETEMGLQAQTDRAIGGSPLVDAAQSEMGKTLGGEYLNAGNPAFGAMAERIRNQVRPGLDSQFATQGGYGGSAHQEMMARTMADSLAPLEWQNYSAERGNMQNAMQAAPGLANQDYFDIAQLRDVGGQREALGRDQLADDINRFNFEQFEPADRLARYMSTVAGGKYGGTSTRTEPYYTNRSAGIIGGLGALAGAAGSLGWKPFS